jgi:hypothetical protein
MREHAERRARRFEKDPSAAAYGIFLTPDERDPESMTADPRVRIGVQFLL